ncbi:Hypothetical protein AJAP_28040 [Amycolatopsis japonica]|uniref:Uncharacterized protein n=1 Tax=Amycolatopsis japonica TaxID=208439 RepID=A0A075UW95_9PSEU|nr:Hypothetical protein AJAP_28040 [Amycolatopsis japonica]
MENVNVWADAFGVWHASVPLSGSRHRDAMRARKLIVDAIAERSGPSFDPSRVRVTRESITGHGTVKYREV